MGRIKILHSGITGTQTSFFINFGDKTEFHPVFLFFLPFFVSTSTAATYFFTTPTCTTAIIALLPCALNAEFQHFILRFNNILLLCAYH
jgi:hypothetical protein